MGAWRNGSRGSLKSFYPYGCVGSSPSAPTILDLTKEVTTMKTNTYRIIVDCLETGIAVALNRMDKHAEDPLTDAQRDRAAEHLEREIMSAICDMFNFEGDTETK